MIKKNKKETLEIIIDSDTLEYELNIEYCSLKNLRMVLSDIIERIDDGDFNHPDLIVNEDEEDEDNISIDDILRSLD